MAIAICVGAVLVIIAAELFMRYLARMDYRRKPEIGVKTKKFWQYEMTFSLYHLTRAIYEWLNADKRRFYFRKVDGIELVIKSEAELSDIEESLIKFQREIGKKVDPEELYNAEQIMKYVWLYYSRYKDYRKLFVKKINELVSEKKITSKERKEVLAIFYKHPISVTRNYS